MLPASERQENPFRYSEPVPVDQLIGRDPEATILLERAREGNNSRVVAPRRFGKTSLLRRALHDVEREGWAAVYVDFFGVLTLTDIGQRIERAYAEQLSGRLASWFSGVRRMLRPTVRAGGGPLPGAVELTLDAQAEPPLLERLALPKRLHERHRQRTLVVFDEFQDVLATQDRADAIIRSEIQHHGDAASYIFAGSQVGMMEALFADRRRAFYAQARPVELPLLPPQETAEYIAGRFVATGRDVGGALGPLLDAAGGHPQRTMLLAHALWSATPDEGRADEGLVGVAVDQVMSELVGEFSVVWSSLPGGQRRLLALVADDLDRPYSRSSSVGGSKGSAVRNSLAALVERGEVVRDGGRRSGYRVVDPLLASWVRAGRPSAS